RVYQDSELRRKIAGEYVVDRSNEVSFHVGEYDRARPLVIDPVLTYSTYLGGRTSYYQLFDRGHGIAVDSAGNAYVAGQAAPPAFPTTPGAFQSTAPAADSLAVMYDAFVTKIDATGSRLIYSTYLGGSQGEWANSIAIDEAGNAYVGG